MISAHCGQPLVALTNNGESFSKQCRGCKKIFTQAKRRPSSVAQSYLAGKITGRNTSWAFHDGNTSTDWYRAVLKGYDDGDPEIMELCPSSPLSGETGGESMNELLGRGWTDDDAEAYETGFTDGFWEALLDSCRYQVGP